MKRQEIIEIREGSVFKSIIYLLLVPTVLLTVIAVVLALINISTKVRISSLDFVFMIAPMILMFLLAWVSKVSAQVYNYYSKKYGGLEIEFKEK